MTTCAFESLIEVVGYGGAARRGATVMERRGRARLAQLHSHLELAAAGPSHTTGAGADGALEAAAEGLRTRGYAVLPPLLGAPALGEAQAAFESMRPRILQGGSTAAAGRSRSHTLGLDAVLADDDARPLLPLLSHPDVLAVVEKVSGGGATLRGASLGIYTPQRAGDAPGGYIDCQFPISPLVAAPAAP